MLGFMVMTTRATTTIAATSSMVPVRASGDYIN